MRRLAFWLSLGLIFVIPWENSVDVGSLGTVGRGVGMLAAVVWVASVVLAGRSRRLHEFHAVFFFFVTWNVASVVWSQDVNATLDRIVTYAQLFVLALIVWDLYETAEALEPGLQAYVLGALVSVGSIVYNYLTLYDPTRVRPKLGTRSITSITKWNRSRSFKTTMSNGVVVVPSSLYPRTCKFS